MQAPVMVMNANAKRETGRKAQTSNIQAAKAVADIIRTTLGPRSMLKMILDPMGGIVMTNDGSVTAAASPHTVALLPSFPPFVRSPHGPT